MANGVIIPTTAEAVKIETFVDSRSLSITGSSDMVVTIDTYSKPAGYTPIGALIVTSNQIEVGISEFNVDNGSIRFRNYSASTRAIIPGMKVAFMRNDLL